jgi:hypothetical protein
VSYHVPMDRAAELMLSHSNAGTLHAMDSARHFFVTRLMYEGLTHDIIPEAKFDQLVDEAWAIFILPAITSYHTWLKEVMVPDPEVDFIIDEILADIRQDWTIEMQAVKTHFLENLA